ncbi:GntR family transcriptional regulator [Enterovibrio makurazakiensis]|uniref:GntR family transcriptional regulator n=1 Tax=Enterovibrio gelatinilyticus TaxID=2899819 RepID=A0ABT5R3Z0_9GAMM|nr:GntR family transcriptional regulator [Enterovibrio sp. ZSDZ42]MDD1794989.1 GntR family transcriptional regulator [Enterovibrio sp. ZSDZ42]
MNLYETLRTDLLRGDFKPGSRLRMESLKTRYGSGVNLLRECLTRLASDGLVIAEGQKGFHVASFSPKKMEELTRLRILLEADGAEQSFVNGDMEWESNLVAAHHKLEHVESKMRDNIVDNFVMWHRCDYEFHAALIGACNSELHMHYHRQIYDQFRQFVMMELRTNGFRGTHIIDEHQIILEAALNRDLSACVSALEAHLGGFVERLREFGENE